MSQNLKKSTYLMKDGKIQDNESEGLGLPS